MKDLFLLRHDITFLNFGSFGSCPKEIFEDYIKWQYLLENEPVQFITVDAYSYIHQSLAALASYVHCDPKDLIYVPNPTHAINILAKSLTLKEDDEILTTDLEYGAIDRTWKYYCKKYGGKYIQQKIELPIVSKEKFLEDFWKGYSAKTKIIFISQITSSTGLILPVKEICEEAKKRGLITIVDGAHVPGHIDLNLSELKADFYTGACHKWMMTPKGSSFLFVKKEFQNLLDPLIISWGYDSFQPSESQFFDYHQFNGTRDFSAYLTIPKAIEFMDQHNWKQVSTNCKQNVLDSAPIITKELGTEPLAPLGKEFFGQMFSSPIKTTEPEKLKRILFEEFKIEIPVMRHGNNNYIRYSMQAYNDVMEIENLAQALRKIKKDTTLIE